MALNDLDFIPGGLSGNIQIINKNASFAKTIVADAVTEGNEKFIAKIRRNGPSGNIVAQSNVVIINDTSAASPLPTFNLAAVPTIVNEGSGVTFTLTTTGLEVGANVAFRITGISSDDINGAALDGNFTIGVNGISTKSYTLTADNTTEGTEIMSMSLLNVDPLVQVNVLINDISQTPANLPSYILTTSTNFVSEGLGNSVTINLQTTNVAAGNLVPYTITGVSSSDLGNASLTGNFTISNAGTDFKVFDITPDRTTEGIETMIITLDNITPVVRTSFIIFDSSQSPDPASYTLTANVSQVNEGSSVRFTLLTTNVPVGAKLPYTITGAGVTTGDFINNVLLTGVFTIEPGGIATLDLPVSADAVTEGNETLTLTVDNTNPLISASVLINDTSKLPRVGYALSADKYSIDEGETVTITLTTIGVAAGSTVPWNMTGIDGNDLNNFLVSGFFTVSSSDVATTTVQVPISLDQRTEGNEILIFQLTGKTVSIAIQVRDTSKDPVPAYVMTYQLIGVPPYINDPTKETINQWYRAYVGRDADDDGLSYWIDRLNKGAITLDGIKFGIQSSGEASTWDGIQRASEGQSVKVNLLTANVTVGSSIPYTITGVPIDDIGNTPLNGSFVVGGTFASGTSSITLPITMDNATETTEIVKVALNSITPEVSTTFQIYDTSKARFFGLTANVSVTDENRTVRVTLTTIGVRDGIAVPFRVFGTGITSDDLVSTRITWNSAQNAYLGEFTVNNNGDFIDIIVEGDSTAEGPESFTVTTTLPQPPSVTVNINDTSVFESGTAATSNAKSADILALLPKNEIWVAFKMLGAGGAGGGSDGQPNSGFGYYAVADEVWNSFLNAWGVWVESNASNWTNSFTIYFPSTTDYVFQICVDNSGWIEVDNANRFNWSDFATVGSVTRTISAGFHTVTISATNTGGPAGIAVNITQPGGYIIWTTRELAENGGGAGGAGNYIQGIVKLPKTASRKYLVGAVGEPGQGGSGTGTKVINAGGFGAVGGASIINLTSGSPGAPTAFSVAGYGGNGAQDGPGGSSGGGGGGGGASALFYVVGEFLPDQTVTNIATAGGGGGGGGGSWRTPLSRRQNANDTSNSGSLLDFTTFFSTRGPTYNGRNGEATGGDGGGGGGGGGASGNGGADGDDGANHGQGGGAGFTVKNNSLTWNVFESSNYTADPVNIATGSTRFPSGLGSGSSPLPPQPYNFIAFGRGGPGLRPWFRGVGGQRGAIALYWSTAPTPPTLDQVPAFPWPAGSVSLPNGDATSGISIYSDGGLVIGSTVGSWHVANAYGIGEFYQFRCTQEAATSGGTANQALVTGITFGEWVTLFPYGTQNQIRIVADSGGNFNLRVQIRRRDSLAIVAEKVYENINTPAPPQGGGGCCVISTALAEKNIWSQQDKFDLIEWCEKYLHNTWWGETFRRGYQVLGAKIAIPIFIKKDGSLLSKYADWAFTNGTRMVRGKKFDWKSLPNSIIWIIGFMAVGAVVTKSYATKTWLSLYKDKK
jgi:hypothetical protein